MKILYMDCFLGFSAGMLLGALIDAGANPDEIYAELEKENIDLSISVQYTDRASIRCRKAFAVLQKPVPEHIPDHIDNIYTKYGASDETTPGCMRAVAAALKLLGIEYIITSDVSLNETADGTVLELLNNEGIEIMPGDENCENMQSSDAAFLCSIANECGPRPDMQVLSIGYGAGGIDPTKANIITAVIGNYDSNIFLENEEYRELISAL